MSLWQQFLLGVRSYIQALSFIFNNGLWIYFIYPLIIGIILFFGSFSAAGYISDKLEAFILGYLEPENAEGWLGFLSGALHIFLTIGLKIIFFFIYSTFSKYITLIIMSPIMALLSERTEELITGKKFPFELSQFIKDILRGIVIALRNMIIEFGFIFLCMLVVWIPLLGWVTPVFLMLISYYFYGFSMMDYSSERHKLNVSESVRYIRKHKGVAIGNGFIFSLLFAFPIIGSMLSTVLAPVAATIAVVELKK